jgi:hypothetical protein
MAMVNWVDLHVVLMYILPKLLQLYLQLKKGFNIGTSYVYGGSHPAKIIERNQTEVLCVKLLEEVCQQSAKKFWFTREFWQESCHLKLSTATA